MAFDPDAFLAEGGTAEGGTAVAEPPAFDPDAFLAESEPFDPDAFLANESTTTATVSAVVPPGQLFAGGGGGAPAAIAAQPVEAAPAAEQPVNSATGDFFRRIGAGIASGTADAFAAGYKIQQDIPFISGAPVFGVVKALGGPDILQHAKEFAQDISARAAGDYGVDPARDQNFSSTIAGAIGQLVPTLASGPLAPITGGAMMGESARKEAEAAGGTTTQENVAFYSNAAVGAITEKLLGLPALLKAAKAKGIVPETLKLIIQNGLKQAGKQSVREGTQEGLEQVAGNFIASDIAAYDPNRPVLQGVGTAIAAGAILGAPVGGAVQVATDMDANRSLPMSEQAKADLRASTEAQLQALAPAPVPMSREVQKATPEVIDGLLASQEKLVRDFSEQPPFIQQARQTSLDDIDAQLLRFSREDVAAGVVREKARQTAGPAPSPEVVAEAAVLVEAGAPLTAQAVVETAAPVETAPANPNDFVPAIKVDGVTVRGNSGETHQDVLNRFIKENPDKEAEALVDFDSTDNPNFFLKGEEAVSRSRLKEAIGVTDSQGLRDLQAKAEPSTSSVPPKTRIEMILDEVEKSGEVTLSIDGEISREQIDRVTAAANERGLLASFDGSGFLIRKPPRESAQPTPKTAARQNPLDQLRELEADAEPTTPAKPAPTEPRPKSTPEDYIRSIGNETQKLIVERVLLQGMTVEEAVIDSGTTLAKAGEYAAKAERAMKDIAFQGVVREPAGSEVSKEGRSDEIDEVVTGEQGATASRLPALSPSTATPAPVVPIKAQSQIIRDLSEGLKIPMRFGRLTTKKFGGYFKEVQNLIGAKRANDLPIIAHEAGHKLDAALGLSREPTIRAELDQLGDPTLPGSASSWKPSKGNRYKLGEGIAEFVRYWMVDPAQAMKLAPKTHAYFEAALDANPDLGSTLLQAREDVQNWRNAPAEARIDSSISIGGNPNKTRYGLDQLTRDLVDDLHIVRLAVDDAQTLAGKDLKLSENPYLLARLLRGSYGMADTFIRRGVVDYKTRKVTLGSGLEDALKPVAGKIVAFRRYMVSKRAQELRAQGRETGLVDTDVDFVVNKYDADPAFVAAFDAVKKWNDSLLQYAEDSGYVSKEGAAAMRAMNADYVPFHRLYEIGAGESPSVTGGGSGRGLNVGKVGSLKKLKGSTRDIVDPLESMIKNAYALITASEKSAINKSIGDLSNNPGMGKWVEEIATPKEAVRVAVEKVRKQLESAGADLDAVPDDLLLQFFRDSGQAPYGENVIKVTSDGKTKFYRLKSDLFDAFHALDLEDSSTLLKMLSAPAQLLRAGVTLDPAFSIANVMRDAVGSSIISKHGMKPFEASIRGVVALLKNPKLVAEWEASGGKNSIEAAFFDQRQTAKYLSERITKDLTTAERATVILKSPLRALRAISEAMESATRVGEFQKALQENIKSGMTEGDARRMAAFESRDRQDFAKGGAKTKILRHMAAFWNASLQGNVKLYEAFKERPAKTTLRGMAYITLPTVLAMAVNWDDEDYWDRPQWERDAFWLIPKGKDANGKSTFIRIPKPFLLGVMFGTVPERFMQWAKKNRPEEFGSLLHELVAQTIPNPFPQTATVIAEVNAGEQGYSFFQDKPIVPEQMAEMPPDMQWTEQTSLTARKIGTLFGVSPMKVDHVIRSTTGGLGKQVVHNAIDRAIGGITGENTSAKTVEPFGRFFTSPAGISSYAVEKFYENISQLRKSKEGEKAGGKAMDAKERKTLASMEGDARKMSELRRQAKASKKDAEKQRQYLKISEIAAKYQR